MEGGDNEFVDSFHIGEIIREKYPTEWKILTETKVDFHDVGVDKYGEFYKVQQKPTFT